MAKLFSFLPNIVKVVCIGLVNAFLQSLLELSLQIGVIKSSISIIGIIINKQ
jgi:hypothetical protein